MFLNVKNVPIFVLQNRYKMKNALLSKQQLAAFFKVPIENIQSQYEANTRTLEKMRNKALATGKKVNNYTAAELVEATAQFQIITNQ